MLPRGRKPTIPADLWPKLQSWERAGCSQAEMIERLAELGITASQPAVSRAFAAMREHGMAEDAPKPPPVEISDADEVKEIRRIGRQILYSGNEFAALTAARLLLALQDRKKTTGAESQPEPEAPEMPSLPTFTVQRAQA